MRLHAFAIVLAVSACVSQTAMVPGSPRPPLPTAEEKPARITGPTTALGHLAFVTAAALAIAAGRSAHDAFAAEDSAVHLLDQPDAASLDHYYQTLLAEREDQRNLALGFGVSTLVMAGIGTLLELHPLPVLVDAHLAVGLSTIPVPAPGGSVGASVFVNSHLAVTGRISAAIFGGESTLAFAGPGLQYWAGSSAWFGAGVGLYIGMEGQWYPGLGGDLRAGYTGRSGMTVSTDLMFGTARVPPLLLLSVGFQSGDAR